MQIFGFLGSILGYLLWGIFYLLQNFGLSIIIFTIIVKLVLFPFSIKQQKSMAGTARLSKKQKELQEKYANNRQKLQEEMNKLYEKEGVKPMGGCVTMLIPMLVLFGVFYAVSMPLSNTLHLNGDSVAAATQYLNTIPGYATNSNIAYQQIYLLKIFPNIANTARIQELFSAADIASINHFASGFNIFGVDLLAVPNDYGIWSWYILFPVFCFLSNVGTSIITQKINGAQTAQQNQGCMKIMIYVLPLFSAYIAFIAPCALSFYWIISALLSLVQSILLGKIFSPVQLTANSEARHAALMFENEAKVPYVYAPREVETTSAVAGKKPASKKKKK